MKRRIISTFMAGLALLCLVGCGGGTAEIGTPSGTQTSELEEWTPSGPVSIIIPAGAGGNTDLSARAFAKYAQQMTGVEFTIVNASGSAGALAANQVLGAEPDGYTFLYGHNLVNVANIAGITDYNYSAFKLGPTFAKDPAQQFYVNPAKYADLHAFLDAAEANPGQLKACTETGGYTYYELLAFEKAAGIDLELVNVGSNSDKIAAMFSGEIDLMPGSYINCKDYVETGAFTCLGAPTEERYEVISDIPTLKEQGIDLVYPDCDFSFYFPLDTPDAVITWYENLVEQIVQDPKVQDELKEMQMIPYYLSGKDSEAHDEEIYNTIQGIVDELGMEE